MMTHRLREWIVCASVFSIFCVIGQAQEARCKVDGNSSSFLGISTVRLWPGNAPDAKGQACEDVPTLTVFEPQPGYGNGSAVLVVPGGAYSGLASNLEGRQVADWFTARGFVAFILRYRLPSNGYLLPVPLLDARRAVQVVRAQASQYRVDPNRIGMIGFSAGGHLAALTAVRPIEGDPNAKDLAGRQPSRLNFLVLGYPWIGAISSSTSHLSYCRLFNVLDKCDALSKAYSPQLFVTKNAPPTFWYHTTDDPVVPVEQGLRFYEALLEAGVPAEAHLFAHGAHGTGLGIGDQALSQWPNLLENWLRSLGLTHNEKN